MRYAALQKKMKEQKLSDAELEIYKGLEIIGGHSVFHALPNAVQVVKWKSVEILAKTNSDGDIFVNMTANLYAKEWAYAIVHCALHHVFGHFDKKEMPDTDTLNIELWNQACDIYVTRFLSENKIGQALVEIPEGFLPRGVITEKQIYQYLIDNGVDSKLQPYGMASRYQMDMEGLEEPLVYDERRSGENAFRAIFNNALYWGLQRAVDEIADGDGTATRKSFALKASKWFIEHYPLLGGLAASFQLIEDNSFCVKHQIQIAAVDINKRKIYINPAMKLNEMEWRFILAHEYLHAGLCHANRCQSRDAQIWNIACDFVINEWLIEMQIGTTPPVSILYDPSLSGESAESIYDMLVENIRKARKLETFRGYGMGDMFSADTGIPYGTDYTTFDDVCRAALVQGLEYHQSQGRGLIPAGLIEEIRTLSMPPVPWDVKLAYWFQEHLPLREKVRTYARPSRRQGATPDIPRPRYVRQEELENSQTFGVIIDTSGSMSVEMLGKALGTIASYAESREVRYVRVIFCDAIAYDAGYMTVEELAGKVEVKGRGGTKIQPAIDLLETAHDFPKDGPILIITDGYIEQKITIRRTHAWLLPEGNRLPFRTSSPIFQYM